jgi:hypothetical protein
MSAVPIIYFILINALCFVQAKVFTSEPVNSPEQVRTLNLKLHFFFSFQKQMHFSKFAQK